ncbi:MAG: tetratricopeptide repeat protein [Candidatus Riflebacteria bacterium]|nr:tetratricopeptide repeat protein [Candidatus Riflebacteria bacterium]
MGIAEEKALLDTAINTYKKGETKQALVLLKEFIRDYPDSDLADNACYNIAKIATMTNDTNSALSWYEFLLENYPDSDAAYFAQDEYTELCRTLGKPLPDSDSEVYFKAYEVFKKNDYVKSEQMFLDFVKKFPKSEMADDAIYRLAQIEKSRGNKERCMAYLDLIATRYPDSDQALYLHKVMPGYKHPAKRSK